MFHKREGLRKDVLCRRIAAYTWRRALELENHYSASFSGTNNSC
jgi:hypothetical protein